MLNNHIFEISYIEALQKNTKLDPGLIERVIFAFSLLESLVRVRLPFIFKGGTSLLLLLDDPGRISTDIDIMVDPRIDIEPYLQQVLSHFPFRRFEEQKRVSKKDIVKRHFKFFYLSPISQKELYVILDVLFEKNHYTKLMHKEIRNDLLEVTEPAIYVDIPDVNSISGDKLTAFAPKTIGIPFGQLKEMEIIKQFYDIATLFDKIDDIKAVIESYQRIAKDEILYRDCNLTPKDCLKDTIKSSLCLIRKGDIENYQYDLFSQGIRSIKQHIFSHNFSAEIASQQACKVLYLATAVLTYQPTLKHIVNSQDYAQYDIEHPDYKKVRYMKKVDVLSYGYLIEALRLMDPLIIVKDNNF